MMKIPRFFEHLLHLAPLVGMKVKTKIVVPAKNKQTAEKKEHR